MSERLDIKRGSELELKIESLWGEGSCFEILHPPWCPTVSEYLESCSCSRHYGGIVSNHHRTGSRSSVAQIAGHNSRLAWLSGRGVSIPGLGGLQYVRAHNMESGTNGIRG